MHGIALPSIINPTPLNWNALPKEARDHLPKFGGDGKTTVDEHLNAFNVAYGIIVVQHEDVTLRIFVQTLTAVAAGWFYHLPNSVITNWQDLKTRFEARLKVEEDETSLLALLAQLKKEVAKCMRDFVEKFNKIVHEFLSIRNTRMTNLNVFHKFHAFRDRLPDP